VKKILVTGASGFIGSALTRCLLLLDVELYLFTRDIKKLSKFENENVKKFEVNFLDISSLDNLDIATIDVVVHLAASASFLGRKNLLFNANVASTINLYEWAVKKGVKRFIFASSIEAMGVRGEPSPATENDLVRPVSSYGESKLQAEKALHEHIKTNNSMELVILRIGNVYGPGGPFIIVPLINAMVTKTKHYRFLSCYGKQKFQFIYIDDLVDGIIRTIAGESVRGTYILTGREPIRIFKMLELFRKMTGKDFENKQERGWRVRYLTYRTKVMKLLHWGDLPSFMISGNEIGNRRTYSIRKAEKELGFSPKIFFEEGIKKTLQWAQQEGMLKSRNI
jgi:nucleoside-diphosphate-sugar epimerase